MLHQLKVLQGELDFGEYLTRAWNVLFVFVLG